MKLMTRMITLAACCVFLFACSNQEEDVTVKPQPATTKPKPNNNPLASQQQLIRDAKKVQGILDQDAERKKKALQDSN